MNDLKLLAGLRSEVPLEDGARLSDAVIAAIALGTDGDQRAARHGGTVRRGPRRALRPLLAGTLAAAVGSGAFAAVERSGAPAFHPGCWQMTADWAGHTPA